MNTEILQQAKCLNQLTKVLSWHERINKEPCVTLSYLLPAAVSLKRLHHFPTTHVLFNPCDLRIYSLKMGLANTHKSGCYLSHLHRSSYIKYIETYSVINSYKTKCTALFLYKAYKFTMKHFKFICYSKTPQKICNNACHTVLETVV